MNLVDWRPAATVGSQTVGPAGDASFAETAIDVGSAEALEQSGRLVVHVPFSDLPVIVVRSGRRVFAFANRCPHMGRSLSDARVRARSLECPGHGKRFDLSTGRAANCAEPLQKWDAWTSHGRVWISSGDPR